MHKKDAAKAKGSSAVGARTAMKTSKNTPAMMTPVMKHRKKNARTDPLFVEPHDDAYTSYFKELEVKRAPNFTAVEDLVLCKAYKAVSEDPTVGTDQTAETFWGKGFESLVLLSVYEVESGMFYKCSPKSLKHQFPRSIQPSMNTFNRYFKNMKNQRSLV